MAGADLSGFATARIEVAGQPVEVWLAETPEQQSQGLRNATPEQLLPLEDGTPRGMLFLFAAPQFLSFWMLETYVPLDLAYVRADGLIAEVHDLLPLDPTPVVASEPVQYALEVPSGTLEDLGAGLDDLVSVPCSSP